MKNDSVYIIGRHPVREAILSGQPLLKILLFKGITVDQIIEFKKLAKSNNIPISLVPIEVLDRIKKGTHQGVIAETSLIQTVTLQDAIAWAHDKGENPLFVMLDGITDIRNLGSIARSAWSLGAHALITSAEQSIHINEDAIKASAGAILHIPIVREKTMTQVLTQLQEAGILVIATVMKAEQSLYQFQCGIQGVAILLGNEENGIRPHLMRAADIKLSIPMHERFESLNVSNTAAIFLYEIAKQRSLL